MRVPDEQTLAEGGGMKGGWLKQAVESGEELSAMGKNIGLYNFIAWGNMVDANESLPEIWAENFPINLKYWDENPDKVIGSAMDIPAHEGQCIIFVGNGPSLMKAIEMFPEGEDRKKFVICCANSSLETLLKHDIVPDYVILVDGRTGHWTLDIDDDRCKDVIALFSPAATPEAVKAWKGKCYVIPYKLENEELTKTIQERWGTEYPTSGGNSINCAVAMFAHYCFATTYILVGNELSWTDNYYADGRAHKIDTANSVNTHNIYGEPVKTSVGHFEYKLWLENFIKGLYPRFYIVNCSEGIVGVENDGTIWPYLNHMPLDMAVQDFLRAVDFENKDVMEKTKEMYERLYSTGRYGEFNGAHDGDTKHGNYQALENYLDPDNIYAWKPFKTILDVGCGAGKAVKILREKDYDAWGCDIAELTELWRENGVWSHCYSTPAHELSHNDGAFDMVMCTDVMEHIHPDYVDRTLDEICRVGKKYFYFSIACCPESVVSDKYGVPLHLTIMPPIWWMDKLKKKGITPIYHGIADDETYVFVYGEKR
jgi:SAM-dependent methyltransferase